MPRRVIQHATSASRRTRRVAKPTTPWRRALASEVSKELREANKGKHPRWVRCPKDGDRTALDVRKESGYGSGVVPKALAGENTSVTGSVRRKDCELQWLSNERKEARDYFVQERAEQHLTEAEKKRADLARSKGFDVKEDRILGDEE